MAGMFELTCPSCGALHAIDVFAADKEARRFAVLTGRLPPPLSTPVLRYLSLFAPVKHRITISRACNLLEPLVQMIEAGRITRAKREWVVSLAQFEAGLQQLVDKRASLTLPLKSHGYLLEVLAGEANKLEAASEAQEIARARSGEARQAQAAEQQSEAAEWDEGRRQQAAKLAAVSAMHAEIAGLKRLKLPITESALATTLIAQGFTHAAVDFALSKSPLRPTPPNTPGVTP